MQNTQSVIVYRSRVEQAQDEFLMENAGLAFPVIAGLAVAFAVGASLSVMRVKEKVYLPASFIAGILTAGYMFSKIL